MRYFVPSKINLIFANHVKSNYDETIINAPDMVPVFSSYLPLCWLPCLLNCPNYCLKYRLKMFNLCECYFSVNVKHLFAC